MNAAAHQWSAGALVGLFLTDREQKAGQTTLQPWLPDLLLPSSRSCPIFWNQPPRRITGNSSTASRLPRCSLPRYTSCTNGTPTSRLTNCGKGSE
jgi:hypothetical protein